MDDHGEPEVPEYAPFPTGDELETMEVRAVDTSAVLERLGALEIRAWSRDFENGDATHLGPVAEDFQEAFELGGDPDEIALADPIGIAFAAIQAMTVRLEEQAETIDRQQRLLERQRDDLETIRERLEVLQSEVRIENGEHP